MGLSRCQSELKSSSGSKCLITTSSSSSGTKKTTRTKCLASKVLLINRIPCFRLKRSKILEREEKRRSDSFWRRRKTKTAKYQSKYFCLPRLHPTSAFDLLATQHLPVFEWQSCHFLLDAAWLQLSRCFKMNNPNRVKLANLVELSKGSGCGSGGRAVASDTRDPQFESQHLAKFNLPIVYLNRTDENQGKRGQEWPILKSFISKYVQLLLSTYYTKLWHFSRVPRSLNLMAWVPLLIV